MLGEQRASHALQRLAETPALGLVIVCDGLPDSDRLELVREIHGRAPQLPSHVRSPTRPKRSSRRRRSKAPARSSRPCPATGATASWPSRRAARRELRLAARRGRLACDAAMHRRIDALSILYDVVDRRNRRRYLRRNPSRRSCGRCTASCASTWAAPILVPERSTEAVLHLHCQEACEEQLLQKTRDRCLDLYRKLSSRALDEGQLAVNLSGERMGSDELVTRVIRVGAHPAHRSRGARWASSTWRRDARARSPPRTRSCCTSSPPAPPRRSRGCRRANTTSANA